MKATEIHMPFGIAITDCGSELSSELRLFLVKPGPKFDVFGELATHALESLLLALVAEGVDLRGRGASKARLVAAGQCAHTLVRMRGGAKPPRAELSALSSELRHLLVDPNRRFDVLGELAVHVLDSLLYTLAAEGVDVSGPGARAAIGTAAQSVGQWMASYDD